MLPLEAVPNFSEGRERATIDAIGSALAAHAELLDVHSDEDHNRSVYTLVGEAEQLVDALLAGVAVARERIDLRRHEGAHPRIGAADVVPLVPIRPEDAGRARAAALELARRVGKKSATASRAVGQANATNPIAIVVPCHRVIGHDGKLTGYAAGLSFKAKLLTLEGALAPDDLLPTHEPHTRAPAAAPGHGRALVRERRARASADQPDLFSQP